MTVAALRKELRGRGQDARGNKAALVARLTAVLSAEAPAVEEAPAEEVAVDTAPAESTAEPPAAAQTEAAAMPPVAEEEPIEAYEEIEEEPVAAPVEKGRRTI